MTVFSFSKVIPFEGIPHAGGEYYLRFIRTLSRHVNVQVCAPHEPRNAEAPLGLAPPQAEYMTSGRFFHESLVGIAARKLVNLRRRINPIAISAEFYSAIFSRNIRRHWSNAEVLDVQWVENAGIIPWLRKFNPRAHICVVAHDVLSQKYRRQVASTEFILAKLITGVRLRFVTYLERKYLGQADSVIVFSDKDKELLVSMDATIAVEVVRPPLADVLVYQRNTSDFSSHCPELLFTGAFGRIENQNAAMWLLRNVWPKVLSEFPAAKLVLAGSSPSDELCAQADKFDSVEVTGYVDDLSPYYSRASCFVAPIFEGAGVKFKVITALNWGIPIVATPVAAEGIGGHNLFAAVTSDPNAFAASIVDVLRDPIDAFERARSSQHWVRRFYGQEQFEQSLISLYSRI
ncbi:glycosyltransferase [Kocuria flava]|uniref:glycosyltransferase n=1 Tax=Kocuria flava TaxID=446860 RepID=UPI002F954F4B